MVSDSIISHNGWLLTTGYSMVDCGGGLQLVSSQVYAHDINVIGNAAMRYG